MTPASRPSGLSQLQQKMPLPIEGFTPRKALPYHKGAAEWPSGRPAGSSAWKRGKYWRDDGYLPVFPGIDWIVENCQLNLKWRPASIRSQDRQETTIPNAPSQAKTWTRTASRLLCRPSAAGGAEGGLRCLPRTIVREPRA
jgi:hypothetical protein